MGYTHIDNLDKDERILAFREVYALEKIHGTGARVCWKQGELTFSGGSEKHARFAALFDADKLSAAFETMSQEAITVYGEAYGGSQQRMKATYGIDLKFVAFDVKIGDLWLSVPKAAAIVTGELGLEFVSYQLISTDLDTLNAARNGDSVQAVRNGMGMGKKAEGVVLRPIYEVRLNNGQRLIAKYRSDAFRETKTPRKVGVAPEVLTEARLVAEEWVTDMRLTHVLQKLPDATGIEHTGQVVRVMVEDVLREGAGEVVDGKAVQAAIKREASRLYRNRIVPS